MEHSVATRSSKAFILKVVRGYSLNRTPVGRSWAAHLRTTDFAGRGQSDLALALARVRSRDKNKDI